MNLENNYNNYKTTFNGINKKDAQMSEKNEDMTFLLNACKEKLLEKAELGVPQNGAYSNKVSIGFVIPDSNNRGILSITHSLEDPKETRILSLGVHHKNSDRIVSNILLSGTKDEILEFLKSSENTQMLVDIAFELSDDTDKYFSSL